jgi:hypothetical protein
MTEQELQAMIDRLDKAFPLLDEIHELIYFLDAIDVTSENLSYGTLEDFLREDSFKRGSRDFVRFFTQVRMITEFSKRSKEFIKVYNESLESYFQDNYKMLCSIKRESIENKDLSNDRKQALETCDNYLVDNSSELDYYYW